MRTSNGVNVLVWKPRSSERPLCRYYVRARTRLQRKETRLAASAPQHAFTFLSPESCYQICFQCPAPTLMLLSIAPRNPRLSLPTFLLVPSSALLLAYLYALVSLPEHAQIDDRESRCDPLTLTMWQWS